MGIVDEDVQRVREATDLVELAREHIALKRVGRRFVGLCPFHAEKSGSFNVNPDLGVYMCFGCQARGDAITFVRELEHLDFVGAVERLAQRAGITLRYTDANVTKDRQRKQRLHDAVAAEASTATRSGASRSVSRPTTGTFSRSRSSSSSSHATISSPRASPT